VNFHFHAGSFHVISDSDMTKPEILDRILNPVLVAIIRTARKV